MRINAQSTLTASDVRSAIAKARHEHHQDIYLDELIEGSHGAIQFWCVSQNGKFSTGRSHPNGKRAASWTAYGYVIAELFKCDPDARIGRYRGVGHFEEVIYRARDSFYLRQSLGIRQRSDHGENIEFLELVR